MYKHHKGALAFQKRKTVAITEDCKPYNDEGKSHQTGAIGRMSCSPMISEHVGVLWRLMIRDAMQT